MFEQRLKELRKRAGFSQVALAAELGVSQQAVGKWETGHSTPDPQTIARIAGLLGVTSDEMLGLETGTEPVVELTYVPVVGTVKAGYGALAFEEDLGSEVADVKNPKDYIYLMVKGDSMEPRISDGDLALVHRQSTLDNGDLGVMIYGEGEATLKKYIKKDNTVILQPFNPDYQPQIIAGCELDRLYIVGKVRETKTKW